MRQDSEGASSGAFEKYFPQGFPGSCFKEVEVIYWVQGRKRKKSLLLIQVTALKDSSFLEVYHAWEVTANRSKQSLLRLSKWLPGEKVKRVSRIVLNSCHTLKTLLCAFWNLLMLPHTFLLVWRKAEAFSQDWFSVRKTSLNHTLGCIPESSKFCFT